MVDYLHLFNDAQGESHLLERQCTMHEGDFTPPSPSGYLVSDVMNAQGVMVMHHPAGYQDAWHTAPTRVLLIVLAGKACIQTSDGTQRTLHPGDRVLVEDTQGRGHRIDGIDGQAYTLALVLLDSTSDTALGS